MTEPGLSLKQARALQLAALGLASPPRRKAGKADLLAAIRAMGALQIDTIHVVARSPYLVLFSRPDAKAHRAAGVFEVKSLFLEPGTRASERLARELARALRRCADWHGCRSIRLGQCAVPEFSARLAAALA